MGLGLVWSSGDVVAAGSAVLHQVTVESERAEEMAGTAQPDSPQ